MAASALSACFTALALLIFHFNLLSADPSSSFSFGSFDKDPSFESNIALYGDAEVVRGNGSSLVQLTRSVSSSAGRLMCKKPINLVEGNPRSLVSFSSDFSFLISPENGDALAFVMVPRGFNVNVFGSGPFGLPLGSEKNGQKFLSVEFDTLRDRKDGDLNESHVGIDLGGTIAAKVMRNVSSLKSGKRLHSWIDYEAGSKILEVRMSQFGDPKPIDPLLWYPIDLSNMWNDEVFIGLSSSNRNSSQACSLFSWSFKLRHIPQWMHSEPVEPQALAKKAKDVVAPKRSDCVSKVLAAMIFGTACGALGAFIVLYMWTIFGNRRPVVPEDCSALPVDFEYKKVKVVVDKGIQDAKQ